MTTDTAHLIESLRSVIAPGSTHLDVRLSRPDIVMLLGHVDELRAIAIGTVQHVYRGDCTEPDRPEAFDPECPACVAIRGAA